MPPYILFQFHGEFEKHNYLSTLSKSGKEMISWKYETRLSNWQE